MTAVMETVKGHIAKQVRYSWMSTNEPGTLQYVAKGDLRVDHSYQRNLNDAKRLRIASNLNWAAFGVLLVSRRKDGTLFVIDGQHRLAAVMSRSDVSKVPVAIFDLAERDEAVDFLVANKDRRQLSGLDSFKAQIASEDQSALAVNRLIELSGRTAGIAGPSTVACVIAMKRCVEKDPAAMDRVWPTVVGVCEGHAIDNRILLGMFTLERRLVGHDGRPRSVSEAKIHQHFMAAGFDAIRRSISESSAYYKRGGERVFALGCLNVLNYKRQNRFSLDGGETVEAD